MTKARVFDATRCRLGEGPLWHPLRNELLWFDILGRKLFCRGMTELRVIDMPEIVTAAGWIDQSRVLIASETALSVLDLDSAAISRLLPLEAENRQTRSNDGRADPMGGFWIGTMGKKAETGAGAIYRFYRGELRRLYGGISIPNSICFAPDGAFAYWADTPKQQIMRQSLDSAGWPSGAAEVFIDLTAEGLFPDGSVVDAAGHLWNAQWGAGRVAEYDTNGRFLRALDLPARQATCPAFIGSKLDQMICTSAADGVDDDGSDIAAAQGQTFVFEGLSPGVSEPRVRL